MAEENTDWGKGSVNNDIDWGSIHQDSHSPSTNITGEEQET